MASTDLFAEYWGTGKVPDEKDPTDPDYHPPTAQQQEEFADATREVLIGGAQATDIDLDRSIGYLKQFGIHTLRYKLRDGVEKFRGGSVLLPKLFNTLAALAKKEDQGQQADQKGSLLHNGFVKPVGTYLEKQCLPKLLGKTDDALLVEFRKRWEEHKILVDWMRRMYVFVDKRALKKPQHGTMAHHDHLDDCTLTYYGLEAFRDIVFKQCNQGLVTAVRSQVRRDRNGEVVDRALLRSIVQLILIMGALKHKKDFRNKTDVQLFSRSEEAVKDNETYQNDFEAPFLQGSREEFEIKAQEWQATDSVSAYLLKADHAIADEETRCLSFLNPSSKPKLRAVLIEVLIERRLDWCVDASGSGLPEMLRQNKLDDIKRMYEHLSQVQGGKGQQAMGKCVYDYVVAQGNRYVMDRRTALTAPAPGGGGKEGKPAGGAAGGGGAAAGDKGKKKRPAKVSRPIAHDPDFVEKLIAQHVRFQTIIEQQLNSDTVIARSFADAVKVVVNTRAQGPDDKHPTFELLAAFADMVLRGKQRAERLAEDRIRYFVKQVHDLFCYVSDKDLFKEHYQNYLSVRLLQSKTASDAAEDYVLGLMKTSQGMQFTMQLENMISDYKLKDEEMDKQPVAWTSEGAALIRAKDTEGRFARVSCIGESPFEMQCKVLCGAYWPTQTAAKSVPPPLPLAAAIEHHQAAYSEAHKDNRKLEYSMQDGSIEFSFRPTAESRPYSVTTSTVQGIAILVVQELEAQGQVATIGKLRTELQLEIPVLKRVLDPLLIPGKCGPKVPNLLKPQIQKDPKLKRARVDAGGLHPNDSVRVNSAFSNRNAKITAQVLSLVVATKTKAMDNRTHVIDACLVRIMKSRKTLDIQELISEASKQIRMFQLDVRQCRQRIDNLIDKDYMERDEDDSKLLRYIA